MLGGDGTRAEGAVARSVAGLGVFSRWYGDGAGRVVGVSSGCVCMSVAVDFVDVATLVPLGVLAVASANVVAGDGEVCALFGEATLPMLRLSQYMICLAQLLRVARTFYLFFQWVAD